MTVAQIGIKGNNAVIPYVATTKQSKQLDISAKVTATNWTAVKAVAVFAADSTGKWRANLEIVGTFSPAATGSQTFTFTGIVFKNASALTCFAGGTPFTATCYASNASNTLTIVPGTGNSGTISITGDIELNAEPDWVALDTTAATAMEGVIAADVYVAPAGASSLGLVKQGVNVAAAAGATPTKAEFDALLTSLKNAGIIASN
jgi:hypothetical protein